MTWQYKPDDGASRITRAHWFEPEAHWSLCGKVPHGDEWIDDRGGTRNDCRACEQRIMREAKR